MATAAVLPIKRFRDAKQRLRSGLGAGSQAVLVEAMFSDVLSALDRSRALETVMLVTSERRAQDLGIERHVMQVQDIPEKGQSQAARAGLARASALGHDRALLVPGDCPLIDPAELDNLVESSAAAGLEVVLVPDRHERGTNALLLDPSGPFEPQFGPDSLTRHAEQAKRRGLRYAIERVPSLALDIDTAADLAELIAVLGQSHGRAPRTQGVLRQIERIRRFARVAA